MLPWSVPSAIWSIVGVTSACCPGRRGEHWLQPRARQARLPGSPSAPYKPGPGSPHPHWASATLKALLTASLAAVWQRQLTRGWTCNESIGSVSTTSPYWQLLPLGEKRVFVPAALACKRNALLFLTRCINSVPALIPVACYSLITEFSPGSLMK